MDDTKRKRVDAIITNIEARLYEDICYVAPEELRERLTWRLRDLADRIISLSGEDHEGTD
jgi:ribosomal silencing factor RsfS